jgi:hypothetical protein
MLAFEGVAQGVDKAVGVERLDDEVEGPLLLASTAMLTEPWAVITTTEAGICRSCTWRNMSRPSMSGSLRSRIIASGRHSPMAASASPPDSKWVTR